MEQKPKLQQDINIVDYLKTTFAQIRKQQLVHRDRIFNAPNPNSEPIDDPKSNSKAPQKPIIKSEIEDILENNPSQQSQQMKMDIEKAKKPAKPELKLLKFIKNPPSLEQFKAISDSINKITFTERKLCFIGSYPYKEFQEMSVIRELVNNEQNTKKTDQLIISEHKDSYPEGMKLDQDILTFEGQLPSDQRKFQLTLSGHDWIKCSKDIFVNDTIIDFFLKFLQVHVFESDLSSKTYIFSTYFLTKITEKLRNSTNKLEFNTACTKFLKWTKQVDIFAMDFLVIPYHCNLHWSTMVLCYPNQLLQNLVNQADSSMDQESPKRPCLLYFDSMGVQTVRNQQIIYSYLEESLRQKKNDVYQKLHKHFVIDKQQAQFIFTEKTLPSIQPMVQRQDNLYDCGFYMLQYIESFLQDPGPILECVFQQQGTDQILTSMQKSLSWLPRALFTQKRSLIHSLIRDMQKDQSAAVQNYKSKISQIMAAVETDSGAQSSHDQFDDVKYQQYLQIEQSRHPNTELPDQQMRFRYYYYQDIIEKHSLASALQQKGGQMDEGQKDQDWIEDQGA